MIWCICVYLSFKYRCGCCKNLGPNFLLLLLFIAMLLGVGLGVLLRKFYPELAKDERTLMYLEFPGTLLMRMLRFVSLPLIVSSLIGGMSALPAKAAGRLGGRTLVYYLSTTFMAALLGIVLVTSIRPGYIGKNGDQASDGETILVNPIDALLDLIR